VLNSGGKPPAPAKPDVMLYLDTTGIPEPDPKITKFDKRGPIKVPSWYLY
jgi:hypothetical protein